MKYMLIQDGDCHWYIIPAEREDEWWDWREAIADDEGSYEDPPNWALRVDGPHAVTFSSYLVKV